MIMIIIYYDILTGITGNYDYESFRIAVLKTIFKMNENQNSFVMLLHVPIQIPFDKITIPIMI